MLPVGAARRAPVFLRKQDPRAKCAPPATLGSCDRRSTTSGRWRYKSPAGDRRFGVAGHVEMGLHQGTGARIVAGVERIHDAEMLVDRAMDALGAGDPLDVEERAQLVLALHRVEQVAVARAARKLLVKVGVEREQLDRQR